MGIGGEVSDLEICILQVKVPHQQKLELNQRFQFSE